MDTEFQSEYCRYWRLFGASLSENFRSAYFRLMEGLKSRPIPSIEEVTRILYEVPSNKNGRKTLQFSFASKLLHTLETDRPIYDRMVATFYRFTVPFPTKSFEVRLQSFMAFYGFLVTEHRKILDTGSIKQPIADFRHRFSPPNEYTDEKIIDTLIWRAMDLQGKGLLGNQIIQTANNRTNPTRRSTGGLGGPLALNNGEDLLVKGGTKIDTSMRPFATKYHNQFADAMRHYKGHALMRNQIIKILIRRFPDLLRMEDWLYPSDHRINHTNKGACYCAETEKAIFERLRRGEYRVIGYEHLP